MSKPHLIVGYGNMGRRHGNILTKLEEEWKFFDPNVEGSESLSLNDSSDFTKYSSLIICIPPNLHAFYIDVSNKFHIPVLCEKPIFDEPKKFDYKLVTSSLDQLNIPNMVACNYRFVDKPLPDYLSYGYAYSNPYSYLDLIHFVDLYWEHFGKPLWGGLKSSENIHCLNMLFSGNRFVTIHGSNQSAVKYNSFITYPEFEMSLENQMKHWLEVVRKRTKSINPMTIAWERTTWLYGLKND